MSSKPKSVKILCLGDPHYMKNNEEDTNLMEDVFLDKVEKHQPDIIAVMGDVLDRFGNVYTPVLARALYFLQDLSEKARLFVLVGNHDRVNPSDFMSDVHPFIGCQQWDNCTVADEVKIVDYKGFKFCLVPYVPKDRYFEALKMYNVKIDEIDCFMSHQEFKGCRYGPQGESDSRDIWNKSYPLNLNGHIHEYQNLGNLINVGTSYMVSFGEKETKGLSLITLTKENGKTSFTEKRLSVETSLKEIHHVSAKKYLGWRCPYQKEEMKKRNIHISLKVSGTRSELSPLRQNLSRKRSLRETYVYVTFNEKTQPPPNLAQFKKVEPGERNFHRLMSKTVKEKANPELKVLYDRLWKQSGL